jgi:iron complex outermembrane receptor protein
MVADSHAVLPGKCVALLVVGLLLSGVAASARGQGRAVLTGTVVDARDGTALIGAHVHLRNSETSDLAGRTVTDSDGNFQFDRIRPGRYVVEVQRLGYKERQVPMTIEAGDARILDVELELETASLETVVVSASRHPERVLEAPASVSVLEPERLRREVTTSSVEALRSLPGVDVAQTGVDRREVALRGFNGVFSSTPYVLIDNREAGAPFLGLNTYSIMPNMSLDLTRVEVVRGPASALYGPGASGGVVHFFSTNPFRHPGTDVSVAGGSRQYLEAQIREAGVINGTVGYKVTGQFGRANDWSLSPQTPQDAAELSRYYRYGPDEPIPAGRRTVDRQLRRDPDVRKYHANGMLTYRLGSETRLSLRGGYGVLTSPLQTSIGTIQADGLAHSYTQARLETPSVSAQVTFDHNEAEADLYRYRTGTTPIEESWRWDGQATYRFGLSALNTDVTLGGDVTATRRSGVSDLAAGVDAVNETGVYAHTTTPLASDLSLHLATRADYSNITDDLHLSPRSALVFTPSARHAIRAGYNRSVSPPAANLVFGTRLTAGLSPELRTITHMVELGYKGALTDRLWVDLDGYFAKKDNVMATQQVDPLTYRATGPIEYAGVDAALELHPTPALTTFANVSYVSKESFTTPTPDVALNAPSFKVRGGVDYGLPAGFSIGATVHHVDGFPVRSGPYVGTVSAYTLLDMRAAYNVPSVPGLHLTLTGKNVLDNRHREFVGAPPLGRMLMARLTYELP